MFEPKVGFFVCQFGGVVFCVVLWGIVGYLYSLSCWVMHNMSYVDFGGENRHGGCWGSAQGRDSIYGGLSEVLLGLLLFLPLDL